MSNDLGLFLRTLNERIKPELLLERVVDGSPDEWQRTLMNSASDIIMVLASRRIGKSTTVGVMAGQELSKPEHQVIILSKTLVQSQLLFAKIAYTWEKMALPIETKRRTMTELHLKNGSSVVCVPAGQNGEQARGYGVKNGLLIYDEAAFIPDDVFGSTLSIAEDNAKTPHRAANRAKPMRCGAIGKCIPKSNASAPVPLICRAWRSWWPVSERFCPSSNLTWNTASIGWGADTSFLTLRQSLPPTPTPHNSC
mgnify:CR=1 FL=1